MISAQNIRVSIYLLLINLIAYSNAGNAQTISPAFKIDSLNLFDQSRNRLVQVTLYLPATAKKIAKQKLVIFSHGYNANKPGSGKSYSYITENLAAHGYFVASIQHELPTDSLLPATGIPQIVRRTNWERGAKNILFVLNELKKSNPDLDYQRVILMGHSNGGDMTMLFVQQYPALVDKVISLDNRRFAIPRTNHPKIFSIRSSDQPADEGVLPTAEEQVKFSIKIIKLANTIHNDMGDNANDEQRKEINDLIMGFLQDR